MLAINSIYSGDCIELLDQVEDESVDLVLTSPPYDNIRLYNGFSFDFPGIARQLFRVVKKGGVVVWVVADQTVNGSETGTSFRQALGFMEIGFKLHDTMIYMKDNPPPTGGPNRYYQAFEYCFVLSRGRPKTFNPIIEPRRNKWNDKRTHRTRPVTRNKAGIFTSREVTVSEQVKLQNVWSYVVSGGSVAEEKYAHEHPAIFPEALARDHIVSWSNPGDLVLDPMCGSGTTLKMAMLLGRDYLGMDISPEYCKLARRRVAATQIKTGPPANCERACTG